jgi:ribosomal protein S18 acetylase RimI-like enzyme
MIQQLSNETTLLACASVIRKSFQTIIEEFSLTPENAPTNPAFITNEKIIDSWNKGTAFFGLYSETDLVGCIAVEKSPKDQNLFFIERLAVLPELRHLGYGKDLLDFVFSYIREQGGITVSIGIMDNNIKLKDWYLKYGFTVAEIRNYPHLPFDVCIMNKSV